MKNFDKFSLNENIKHKDQFIIDNIDIDDFNDEIEQKSNELGININIIDKIQGIRNTRVIVTINANDNVLIDQLKEWVKNNY